MRVVTKDDQWPRCMWKKATIPVHGNSAYTAEVFPVECPPRTSVSSGVAVSHLPLCDEAVIGREVRDLTGTGRDENIDSSILVTPNLPCEERSWQSSKSSHADRQRCNANDESGLDDDDAYESCPQCCGETVARAKLAEHLEHFCSYRLVPCPRLGCKSLVVFDALDRHLSMECKIVQRNSAMVQRFHERVERSKNKEADTVGTPPDMEVQDREKEKRHEMAARSLRRQTVLEERWQMEMNDDRLQCNEPKACEFELPPDSYRDVRAERSRRRSSQLLECPNSCGKEVHQKMMEDHLGVDCPNRKVPCKNCEFGCPVMVRVRDRDNHENVDELLRPRSALELSGDIGYVAVSSDDIKPPWTAEFWVLRASSERAFGSVFKKCCGALDEYLEAKEELVKKETALNTLKQELSAISRRVAQPTNRDGKSEQEVAAEAVIALAREHQATSLHVALCRADYKLLVYASKKLLSESTENAHLPDGDVFSERSREHIKSLDGASDGSLERCIELLAKEQHEEDATMPKNNNLNQGYGGNRKKNRKNQRKAERKKLRHTRRASTQQTAFLDEDSLNEKVQREISGRGSLDIIASSEKKIQLSLAVGADEFVGFSIAGQGDYSVNAYVPRGRWTHVAYVACGTPKREVSIYVEGSLAGRVKGVECCLPGEMLFAKQHPLSGCVQEIRYWACKRSKRELNQWMHKLLPETSTQEGLLGWWKFEEGRGRYAFDMTENKYQSTIFGRGLRWVTEEDTGLDPPTQSWRERHVCKVELRRARLAKAGREQLALTDCPLGCGDSVMKKLVAFHSEFICSKRVAPTPHWLQEEKRAVRLEYAAKSVERSETVVCQSCEQTVARRSITKHTESECEYRGVSCTNPGCNISLPFCRLVLHQKYLCESIWKENQLKMAMQSRERTGYSVPWQLSGGNAQPE